MSRLVGELLIRGREQKELRGLSAETRVVTESVTIARGDEARESFSNASRKGRIRKSPDCGATLILIIIHEG